MKIIGMADNSLTLHRLESGKPSFYRSSGLFRPIARAWAMAFLVFFALLAATRPAGAAKLCFIEAPNAGATIAGPSDVQALSCPDSIPTIPATTTKNNYIDVLFDAQDATKDFSHFALDFRWDPSLVALECVGPEDGKISGQGDLPGGFADLIAREEEEKTCASPSVFKGANGEAPVCFFGDDHEVLAAYGAVSGTFSAGRSWILARCRVRPTTTPSGAKLSWRVRGEASNGETVALADDGSTLVGDGLLNTLGAFIGSQPDTCSVDYDAASADLTAAVDALASCGASSGPADITISWSEPQGCVDGGGASVSCVAAVDIYRDGTLVKSGAGGGSYTETVSDAIGNTFVYSIQAVDADAFCDAAPADKTEISVTVSPTALCFTADNGWNAVAFPFEPDETTGIVATPNDLDSLSASKLAGGTYEAASAADIQPGAGLWIYAAQATPLSGSGDTVDQGLTVSSSLEQGWNFLGNPYPADLAWGDNISINCLGSQKTLSAAVSAGWIEADAYTFDPETNAYQSANPIPQWAGFFLKANDPFCQFLFAMP